MKHTCKICGAACRFKYCKEHEKLGQKVSRLKKCKETYKEYSKRLKTFYVFYNTDDSVRCFGTAEQLVADGAFPTEAAVRSLASKIKAGANPGNVVILK